MSESAIEVRDLVKAYPPGWGGRVRAALDKVDLVVQSGEGVALVGPNGAGKSTLLMLLSGLRHPTSGTVRVLGVDPRNPKARAGIGLLPDRPALYPEMSAAAHLKLAAAAHGIEDWDVRIAEVLGRLDLGAAGQEPAGRLSAGMQKRVALAIALIPSPSLLLLDEPLAALDPDSVRVVIAALAEERARGTTLVTATHRLADLIGCCDRVVRVFDGAVERLGTTEHVMVRLPVRVVFSLPPGAREPSAGTPEPCPPGVWIRVAPAPRRDVLVEQIRTAGGAILHMSPMLDLLTSGMPSDIEATLA